MILVQEDNQHKEKLDRLIKKLKEHFEKEDITIQLARKLLFGDNR